MRFSNKNTPINDSFSRDLYKIYLEAQKLKRIRLILNELLSCCAYSSHNMELQIDKLEKMKAPDWEIEILKNAYSFKHKKAKQLFKELDKLMVGEKVARIQNKN